MYIYAYIYICICNKYIFINDGNRARPLNNYGRSER